jgi:hypothetical protein
MSGRQTSRVTHGLVLDCGLGLDLALRPSLQISSQTGLQTGLQTNLPASSPTHAKPKRPGEANRRDIDYKTQHSRLVLLASNYSN